MGANYPKVSGVGDSSAVLLHKNYLPIIVMPTFTGGASGAFVLGTALDYAYPHGYGYFDENTLWVTLDEDEITIIDGNAAGFYYVEMSTTTAGVVYNNTYTPGAGVVATIPASPTAFADPIVGGAGFAGVVVRDVVAIPAGLFTSGAIMNIKGIAIGTGGPSGVAIGFDGDLPASYLATDTGFDSSVFTFYAQTEDLQQVIFSAIPVPAYATYDFSGEILLRFYMNADTATDWQRLSDVSVEVDCT